MFTVAHNTTTTEQNALMRPLPPSVFFFCLYADIQKEIQEIESALKLVNGINTGASLFLRPGKGVSELPYDFILSSPLTSPGVIQSLPLSSPGVRKSQAPGRLHFVGLRLIFVCPEYEA
jgi:hypothetical protein